MSFVLERDFAVAWRNQPKWIVSRALKARHHGEIQIGSPELARSLTELGLIDEYQLYFRPIVRDQRKPYFAGRRPPLRLTTSERAEDVMKLTYVPAWPRGSPRHDHRCSAWCQCVAPTAAPLIEESLLRLVRNQTIAAGHGSPLD